ncbi:hypothetical protein [Paraburkholderia xenovorans]|uniref:hypothetical protein n=1 Tax=Paraburkholderia xenovorans TaxID=36873 RepID=UPI0015C56A03|nr:hypothetical protein [Paraburkholderia xenovorans]NPT38144.1 hypothetical protein [Paraburkholderia xenovorans]
MALLTTERGEAENALTAFIADETEASMCRNPAAVAPAVCPRADYRQQQHDQHCHPSYLANIYLLRNTYYFVERRSLDKSLSTSAYGISMQPIGRNAHQNQTVRTDCVKSPSAS